MKLYRVFCWSLLTIALVSQAAEVIDSHHPENANNQRDKPYLLLIGLDGFRHDYAERFGATNLLALGKAGVQASGFVPVFPSETFPSMYSIATGLRPERHGLVANEFYDPQTGASFAFNDGKSAKESRWFGGTPLWVLAEQQGMRAANYFWVGSDTEIQGKHASYWVPYDKTVPNRERGQTVLRWFALAEEFRPHLVTLYFSDVDTWGHRTGPDSPETAEAVRKVDAELGELFAGLRELPVKVNVIVVSDHGMTAVRPERIVLSKFADFTGVTVRGGGALVMYYSNDPARVDKLYRALHGKDSRFSVYRRKDLPEHLHYSHNSRIGDLVVISEGPYILTQEPRENPSPAGTHGFDPATDTNMHGIFFAAGPNIRAGTKLERVSSLDVYPLVARILGLTSPPDLDGKFERVASICRLDAAAQNGQIVEASPVRLSEDAVSLLERSDPDARRILGLTEAKAITYLSDGLKVKGYLITPKQGKDLPCVIYNRGGNREFGALTDASVVTLGRIASWGYVVAASQYRGSDGGEGKEQFGGNDINDVLNLLPLLREAPMADPTRVGMYGRSRGGMMTYLALARTTNISAAVIDAGLADAFENISARPEMEEVYRDLVPNYETDKTSALAARSAVRWSEKLNRTTPILLLHGTADWRISPTQPLDMARALYKHRHPSRLVMFEGGDHQLSEHRPEANRIIHDWLDRYVRDRTPWPSLEPHGN